MIPEKAAQYSLTRHGFLTPTYVATGHSGHRHQRHKIKWSGKNHSWFKGDRHLSMKPAVVSQASSLWSWLEGPVLSSTFSSLALKFQRLPCLLLKDWRTLQIGNPESQKSIGIAHSPHCWMHPATNTSCAERYFCGGWFYVPTSFVLIQPNGKFHHSQHCILKNQIMRAVRDRVKQTKVIL